MKTCENIPNPAGDLGPVAGPPNPAESQTMLSTATNAGGLPPATQSSTPAGGEPNEAHPMPQAVNADAPAPAAAKALPGNWIERVNWTFGRSAGGKIQTGDLLTQAKRQLPPRRWLAAFKSGQIKFGPRTAEMLMALARHPILRQSKYFSSLPSAWSILYVLSRLSAEVVEQGILSGAIHPELRLVEARCLLQSARASGPAAPTPPAPPPFNLGRQKNRVCDYLRGQLKHWPPAYWGELAALLDTLAAVLREEDEP
jgi:hypothetical protein